MPVLRVCTASLTRLFGKRAAWLCLLALLFATSVVGFGLLRGLAQSPAQLPDSNPAATQAQAAASAQAVVSAKPALQAAANAAQAGTNQQIAQLLQMATDLKAAVDKSNKDELSISVVRKAGAIEQLAHKVRSAWPAKDR